MKNIIQDRGVPYIQSVPLLGMFFRSSDDDETKQEIAIFLTPTIITGDALTEARFRNSTFF